MAIQSKKAEQVSHVDEYHLKVMRATIDNLHQSYAKKFDVAGMCILDVAPEVYEGARRYFKTASLETLDIDPESGADYVADLACCELVPDNRFDVIFCTEVLEHTDDPFRCAISLLRILKDTGTLIVTTPFNFRIHNPLPDNWRFTEHGLRLIFSKAGFKRIDIKAIPSDRFLMPIQYVLTAYK